FRDLLEGVVQAWTREPDKVRQNVAALMSALVQPSKSETGHVVNFTFLDQASHWVLRAIDAINGGLGGAPKFPQPFLFDFLWRAWRRSGEPAYQNSVVLTLDHMCHGGIYDHLGGGFHRYATDERWLVPHFEKMLYDNALLIDLLTLVWQDTRSHLYAARVDETVGWVLREMLAEDGAFAASLDADTEGEEGRFYVWSYGDLFSALPPTLSEPFVEAYDCPPTGNWEGKIIINRNKPQQAAGHDYENRLAEARDLLFRERGKRVPPGRDDKILADWNGLMITALVNAGFAFDRPEWIEAARTAFHAVFRWMSRGQRLGHSFRRGRLQSQAMLDDYASMSRAALALFEVTGEAQYLA
ncbi:MAG: thioredoxin domain-containing protein, partial [Rhodospirillales bacterium]|nr:thioredoxin domain-containing protein [Rhodospirillales bacterium]